ncbi:type II and III secretion system protein family protein [Stutzerimonas kirkiae]|uniref:Fimbrial protein n=1 Tax=Stutzerimonas kirkiae TaxID=2211392 RepID=A0A4Q9R4D5_9GAMM|nr:type II and III secretion system protein family protein [Stutzerimonas kirkiae]TBU93532.1 fimbrial protein [Stutzerimonas kirkiae]TBV01738.1 fimbrial protein [Stutzerimonas kirkiae]TBV07436.1 fimbrial protein [Stutzerimonas kirkiae]TBV11069.1 fimbrial protein [Stutzerimonas kirkiae]
MHADKPLNKLGEAVFRRPARHAFQALLVAGLLASAPAWGQLALAVGEGSLLRVGGELATVFVADPKIADVQSPTAGTLLVLGVRVGSTTLYALDANGRTLLKRQLLVRHNLAEMQAALRQRFPALRLSLASAPGSLMVSGAVPDAGTAEAILQTLRPWLGEEDQVVNRLGLSSPVQVYLRVRVTEVSRAITQQLGINWQVLASPGRFTLGLANGRDFTGTDGYVYSSDAYSFLGGYSKGGTSIQAMIDALDQEGLISILAEPNLTAISGQTASFLAGGEFPVPVRQEENTTTVEFKAFGVALDFTPTVLADDRISIKVRPEISEIDTDNSVTVDNISIPGISVRRVETTVEMASGQSFAIGGLLQNNISDVLSRVPGLGAIPVLGKLFSSSDYRNNKSELVVIVTPYLVRPTSPGQLATPLDSMRANSDIEYMLQRKSGYDPLQSSVPRLTGTAGFVY